MDKTEIFKELKKIRQNLTSKDVYEFLRLCPPKSVEYGLRKYKREKSKKKDKLELYVETVCKNYFLEKGEFPSKAYIRSLVKKYFEIPTKEIKGREKFPLHIEEKFRLAYERVYKRYYNAERRKEKERLISELELALDNLKEFPEDKDIVLERFLAVKSYLSKKELEYWKNKLISIGIEEWLFK